jgi:hypothetical protein
MGQRFEASPDLGGRVPRPLPVASFPALDPLPLEKGCPVQRPQGGIHGWRAEAFHEDSEEGSIHTDVESD